MRKESSPVRRLPQQARILGLLIFVALLTRGLLWMTYQPIAFSDTYSYRRLSDQLMTSWKDFDASRTPGYPGFLALVGSDHQVWQAQMGLGVVITLLVFYLAWEMSSVLQGSGRLAFALLAGLSHTLNLGQLFFEACLLTETLATFWLMLALAGWVYGFVNPHRRSFWLSFGIGVSASLTLITRPLFVFLPFWLIGFTVIFWGADSRSFREALGKGGRNWVRSVLGRIRGSVIWLLGMSLPVLIILGGWIGFLRLRYGFWGLSVMTGYHLIQNTGIFFEYVPDEYADLREVYLKYRDAQIAEHGTQTNAIWDAIPEMQSVSGLGFTSLSQLLTRLSIQLILQHPDLYLKNIVQGWWLFWRAPVYWSEESFQWQGGLPLMKGLILLQRLFLFAGNLVFLAATVLAVVWAQFRKWLKTSLIFWLLAGTVWVTSVLQTFLDHGDNARFLVPLQSAVVLCVLWLMVSAADTIRLPRNLMGKSSS